MKTYVVTIWVKDTEFVRYIIMDANSGRDAINKALELDKNEEIIQATAKEMSILKWLIDNKIKFNLFDDYINIYNNNDLAIARFYPYIDKYIINITLDDGKYGIDNFKNEITNLLQEIDNINIPTVSKVKYIGDCGHFDGVTKDMAYNVIGESNTQYRVENDCGSFSTINKKKFVIID